MNNIKRNVIITADGSTTIEMDGWNEHYHSTHGAISEARHVFIQNGLTYWKSMNVKAEVCHLLEIGFGTGLNTWLTYIASQDDDVVMNYTGVEAFPIDSELVSKLNFTKQISSDHASIFKEIHDVKWNERAKLSKLFFLEKMTKKIEEVDDTNLYDLIYFDAFGARVQPELWTTSIFRNMFTALKVGGVLVTYSAKGSVRRAMIDVGFVVERLPGPIGKREMLRASKKN